MLLSLLTLGCSDYALEEKTTDRAAFDSGTTTVGTDPTTDSTPADSDPTGTATEVGECPPPLLDATPPEVDAGCVPERVTDPLTPTVEWENTDSPGLMGAPTVGRLVDTDGDGDVDEDDTPVVVVVEEDGRVRALAGDSGEQLWESGGGAFLDWGTAAIGDVDGDALPDVVTTGDQGATAYAGTDGTVLWQTGYFGSKVQTTGPAIADMDGDGVVEVVAYDRVLDGRTGLGKWLATEGVGGGYGADLTGAVAVVADLDLDGRSEWVAGNAVYRADGSVLWSTGREDGFVGVANLDDDPYGEVVTCRRGDAWAFDEDGDWLWAVSGVGGYMCGPPAIGDLDGDGRPEIVFPGDTELEVLHADGSRAWTYPIEEWTSGFTSASLFDFDQDGFREVVYADQSTLWIFGGDGTVRGVWSGHDQGTANEYPVVADIDGDGRAEIVVSEYPYARERSGVVALGNDAWPWTRALWNEHAYTVTNVNDDGTVPTAPVANWLELNTFHAAEMDPIFPETGADLVPLLVETCTLECAADRLRVVAAVGNAGTVAVPPGLRLVVYAVYGSGRSPVGEVYTDAWIASGAASTGYVFEIDAALVGDGVLEIEVDPDRTVDECDRSDNVITVASGLCP